MYEFAPFYLLKPSQIDHPSIGVAFLYQGYLFFAKLPHLDGHSVCHNDGRGERTLVIGPPCTDYVKNRLLSPLQGRCPCGSLAEMMKSYNAVIMISSATSPGDKPSVSMVTWVVSS